MNHLLPCFIKATYRLKLRLGMLSKQKMSNSDAVKDIEENQRRGQMPAGLANGTIVSESTKS